MLPQHCSWKVVRNTGRVCTSSALLLKGAQEH
ncbi:hypothetical protein E2C01_088616 [Portunus trituberculatus]|uniref:Uncharacterized protein n=1 Tax=Portunus trituberculatus TaxID=210409 RepID=A0A5B7JKC8_PORTR|nr:hypothetical protein [Portunus trituberculatus]